MEASYISNIKILNGV